MPLSSCQIDRPSYDLWLEEYDFARRIAGADVERAKLMANAAMIGRRISQQTRPFTRPQRPYPHPRNPHGSLRGNQGDESQHAIMHADGSLGRVADFDDSPELLPIESTQSYAFAKQADRIFEDIMESETGLVVSPEKYAKRMAEKDRLLNDAYAIANGLARAGVQAMREDKWACYRYMIHSDTLEELPRFRRICLNPYVAAMSRAGRLAALEYFLSLHDPWQYRFWTFTSGKRCRGHEINARCKWLFRKLSKLNALFAKRAFPCEFVFRACEFGTLENAKNTKHGGRLQKKGRHIFYHPHLHCVLFVREFMSEAKWGMLINTVHDFWQRDGEKLHWDAGGMIKNARECVKYVTKPGDMVWLAQKRPEELKRLHEQTLGLRMCTPLGELKKQIRARKAAGLMLARQTTDDGCIWREIKNPDHPFWADPHSEQEHATLRALREEARASRRTDSDVCRVVCRCMPAVGPLRVKEPSVIVMGNVVDMERIRTHPLVVRIREYTREAFEAGVLMATTDFEARAKSRAMAAALAANQCSHGHFNCPADPRDAPPEWPPPKFEPYYEPEYARSLLETA